MSMEGMRRIQADAGMNFGTVAAKEKERQELADDVERFLAAGGAIQRPGVTRSEGIRPFSSWSINPQREAVRRDQPAAPSAPAPKPAPQRATTVTIREKKNLETKTMTATTALSQIEPGPELRQAVNAAFRARGTTFNAWCKEHGMHAANVSAALVGELNGPKAKERRQLIVDFLEGRQPAPAPETEPQTLKVVTTESSPQEGAADLVPSTAELGLMNEIAALGQALQAVCQKVSGHIDLQHAAAPIESDEFHRLEAASPFDWLRQGKQDLQKGLMALTRAVAQPTTF